MFCSVSPKAAKLFSWVWTGTGKCVSIMPRVWTSPLVQVHVMEVECWNATASGPVSVSKLGSSFSSRRASIDVDGMFFAPPDVVIPFTSYVDVGLRTNVKRRQADESVCWAV